MKKYLLLLIFIFIACADTKDKEKNTKKDQESSGPEVPFVPEPIPVAGITFNIDYFTYRTIGQCSDGSLMFKFLSGTGIIFDFDVSVSANIRTAQIDIFIKTDSTYEAHYKEYLDSTNTGSLVLTGNYSTVNETIILENLGQATYFELSNKLVLNFKFSNDIITTGLANKELLLRSILRRDGLITNEEFCLSQL